METATSSEYRTIGLLDHMGWGNMGDAAIQESFIQNIRRRLVKARLIAFSLYPRDTRKRHNIEAYPITWCYPGWKGTDMPQAAAEALNLKSRFKSFLKAHRLVYVWAKPIHDLYRELEHLIRSYKIVRSLDLLIISGGGQFCDYHGALPYNVFKFCVLAKLSNTPVFIVGVGADRLERPSSKFFARWSVQLASYTSLRSDESQSLLRSVGVKTKTHVCPDPAYALDLQRYLASKSSDTLEPAEARSIFRSLGVDLEEGFSADAPHLAGAREQQANGSSKRSTPKVGLNPISFCDPRRWPRKDITVYERYLRELTAFSSWLLAQNYRLEIFTSDMMDVYALEDLRNRLVAGHPSAAASNLSFRPALTLSELFLQMSNFDFVVTSKFHGVIFSHLLEKPVIALSYLPKIDCLMRTVGHDRYCLDVNRIDADWLIERFRSLVHEREQLRSLFRRTSEAYGHAVQVEFDNVFLRNRHTDAPRRAANEVLGTAGEL